MSGRFLVRPYSGNHVQPFLLDDPRQAPPQWPNQKHSLPFDAASSLTARNWGQPLGPHKGSRTSHELHAHVPLHLCLFGRPNQTLSQNPNSFIKKRRKQTCGRSLLCKDDLGSGRPIIRSPLSRAGCAEHGSRSSQPILGALCVFLFGFSPWAGNKVARGPEARLPPAPGVCFWIHAWCRTNVNPTKALRP